MSDKEDQQEAEEQEVTKEPSISENEKFIWLMRVACEDHEVEENLITILSLEKEQRQIMLNNLSTFLLAQGESEQMIQAINYFKNDLVAERAKLFIEQNSYYRKKERKKTEKLAQKQEKKKSKE